MHPMRIPLGVIFLVVLGSGCTTSKILPPQATPVAYREANDRLAGRSAEVRTRDGGLFHLYNVEITVDSVRGSSPFGGAGSRFAIGEVFEIRAGKDRTRGGLIGGAIGAGIALILILSRSVFDDAANSRANERGPVGEVVHKLLFHDRISLLFPNRAVEPLIPRTARFRPRHPPGAVRSGTGGTGGWCHSSAPSRAGESGSGYFLFTGSYITRPKPHFT